MICQIRIGCTDDIIQRRPLPRYDQILEVYGSAVLIVLIDDIYSRDIVIFPGLTDQLLHGLSDAEILVYQDEVRRHLASDLIIPVRKDHLDIAAGLIVHHLHELVLRGIVQLLQDIHGIIGVHLRDDLRGLLETQLMQILIGLLKVRKDLRHPISTQYVKYSLSFLGSQLLQRTGDIIVMIIG